MIADKPIHITPEQYHQMDQMAFELVAAGFDLEEAYRQAYNRVMIPRPDRAQE